MRLGDLDELKVHISELILVYSGTELDNAILNAIDNAPTVTPSLSLDNISDEDIEKFKMIWQRATSKGLLVQTERPQGEWIIHEGYDGDEYYECSVCKDAFVLMEGTPKDNNYNFCPNCGADMRGKDDQLRDCENCVHHSENGCEVWECEFEKRSDV